MRKEKISPEKNDKIFYRLTKCEIGESIIYDWRIKNSRYIWIIKMSALIRFKTAIWIGWLFLKRCIHLYGYHFIIPSYNERKRWQSEWNSCTQQTTFTYFPCFHIWNRRINVLKQPKQNIEFVLAHILKFFSSQLKIFL